MACAPMSLSMAKHVRFAQRRNQFHDAAGKISTASAASNRPMIRVATFKVVVLILLPMRVAMRNAIPNGDRHGDHHQHTPPVHAARLFSLA